MTFPRSNTFGYVDDGSLIKASNRQDKCPSCGSSNYRETVSLEECKSCGLRFDYWGGGSNEAYRRYEARREWEEEQAAEARNKKWREENGYDY